MGEELVLTFPRRLLEELGEFQGIQFDVKSYIEQILYARNTLYLPRARAEEDPEFKQIIPYVLIKHLDTWLHYVRGKASGEKRLTAKGSIGIGGHINPRDESLFSLGREFYETAVQRELHEELKTDRRLETRIVALLNDDSTPVGQVHFGIVHLCELCEKNIAKREASITELRFLTLTELSSRRDRLETWSQFCLDCLPELVERTKG